MGRTSNLGVSDCREQADSSVPIWLGCCVPQHFLQPLGKKTVGASHTGPQALKTSVFYKVAAMIFNI